MDKSVPSSGNTGPRDFSAEVHAHFASPAPSGLVIAARVSLPDDEGIAEIDVLTALRELLARNGAEHGRVEVWREGGNGIVLTSGGSVLWLSASTSRPCRRSLPVQAGSVLAAGPSTRLTCRNAAAKPTPVHWPTA